MKKLSVFMSALGAFLLLNAAETVTVEARGYDASYNGAIQSALKDAVRQVNGSAFRGDTTVNGSSSQTSTTVNGITDDKTSVKENVTDDFREILKGVVLGHRVKSCRKTEDGIYEAYLEVDVAKYTPPMADDRPKVAVVPFKYVLTGFQIGGDGREAFRPAELVVNELSSRTTPYIVRSDRFGVLSREDEAALQAEEKLIADNAPVTEMVKIGQRYGADYLVTGTVRNMYVSDVTTGKSQLTGMVRSSLSSAELSLTYRVIVVSTALIVDTENLDIELSPEELASCYGRPEKAYRLLLERAAQSIGYAFYTNFHREAPPTPVAVEPPSTPQVNVNVIVRPQAVQGGVRLPGDK